MLIAQATTALDVQQHLLMANLNWRLAHTNDVQLQSMSTRHIAGPVLGLIVPTNLIHAVTPNNAVAVGIERQGDLNLLDNAL